MSAISEDNIPYQIVGSDKDGCINFRLQFSQSPAFHHKEHSCALDRHFSDFTLVSDHILVETTNA